MKKLLVILCLVVMVFCFAGCGNTEGPTVFNDTTDQVVIKQMEQAGFVVIERLSKYGDTYMYLVYDEKTKVEYILTEGYCETSLCPYFNENGELVIYKGE